MINSNGTYRHEDEHINFALRRATTADQAKKDLGLYSRVASDYPCTGMDIS